MKHGKFPTKDPPLICLTLAKAMPQEIVGQVVTMPQGWCYLDELPILMYQDLAWNSWFNETLVMILYVLEWPYWNLFIKILRYTSAL